MDKPECVKADVCLAQQTYYRLGGVAAWFAQPASLRELREALAWGRQQGIPVAVLGDGSNCAFADDGFPGLVIAIGGLKAWQWESPTRLLVFAGVSNSTVSELCRDAGATGAEWMFRLPGQIGATARMNGRCYGHEMSEVIEDVFTIDIDGRLRVRSGKGFFSGYKKTVVQGRPEIIYAVRLRLAGLASPLEIDARMRGFADDREGKRQFEHACCGSTFKNDYGFGVPSGRIFDQLGFRGQWEGGIQVAEFHANFLLNRKNGTTCDLLRLTARMRDAARAAHGVDLELEVEPIGRFARTQAEACGLDKLGPLVREGDDAVWAGLLWHPGRGALPAEGWPRTVMASPCLPYFPGKAQSLPGVSFVLEQLVPLAEAAAAPDQPFLRWSVVGAPDVLAAVFKVAPELSDGSFVDELWTHDVGEIFLSHPSGSPYDEYEITPRQHWLAIAHAGGPRVRCPGHRPPSAAHWNGCERFRDASGFGMTFTYARVAHLLHQGTLRVQGAVSLSGARYFLSPHWGTHVKPEPDFHQPAFFWPVSLHGS